MLDLLLSDLECKCLGENQILTSSHLVKAEIMYCEHSKVHSAANFFKNSMICGKFIESTF